MATIPTDTGDITYSIRVTPGVEGQWEEYARIVELVAHRPTHDLYLATVKQSRVGLLVSALDRDDDVIGYSIGDNER